MAGRPQKEFDRREFMNLVGLGCTVEEICWWFRDDTGKPANRDTLSRWCVREFGENFHAYYKKNGGMHMKIQLRRNQLKLSERNAAMAIFLGKNYLGQKDMPEQELNEESLRRAIELLEGVKSAID